MTKKIIKKTSSSNNKKHKKKTKRNQKKWWLRPLLYVFAVFFSVIVIYIFYCWMTLPDISKAIERTRLPATTIITEDGKEISSYGGVYSDIVYAEELPDHVIDAIISTEDRRFYSHFGFDIVSFGRAMIVNIIHRRYVQGGSTITQQVGKNLFLTPQKNIKRKQKEIKKNGG